MIKIGGKNPKIGQHTGFGEKLLKEAEDLSIENGKEEGRRLSAALLLCNHFYVWMNRYGLCSNLLQKFHKILKNITNDLC